MSVIGHPYAHARIGLATIHAKELAIAPPFRRLLAAEIVVAPAIDTDALGTFSGEIARPDALIETCAMKAELVFSTLDVDCAVGAAPCLTPHAGGGYEIDEAEVAFWGRCPSCLDRLGSASAAATPSPAAAPRRQAPRSTPATSPPARTKSNPRGNSRRPRRSSRG